MSLQTQSLRQLQRDEQSAHRLARWSLAMLVVFGLWTAAFIALSGVIAQWLGLEVKRGEVVYIEAWVPWLAMTLIWVLPLVAGLALAVPAIRRGASTTGKAALVLNALVLLLVAGPALVDRFAHL